MTATTRKEPIVALQIAFLFTAWPCVRADELGPQGEREPGVSDPESRFIEHLRELELLVPEGAYSAEWLKMKQEANSEEEAIHDPFAVPVPDGEVPALRVRNLKEHFEMRGLTFGVGSAVKVKVDPSPHYDRLVVRNTVSNHELAEAAIKEDCGAHTIAELRLRRQIELVQSLRKDSRNLKEIDYSEFEIPATIKFLASARSRAVYALPSSLKRGRTDAWRMAQETIDSEPDNPRVIRILALESALHVELEKHHQSLLEQQKRLSALRTKLDEISKLPYESDDPFANCQ